MAITISVLFVVFVVVLLVVLASPTELNDSTQPSFYAPSSYRYGMAIDLGTKGSRLGIFYFDDDNKFPSTTVKFAPIGSKGDDAWYYTINPGIATLTSNPTQAGVYLSPLLDFASKNIPSELQSSTPLFIFGTEGLRVTPNNILNTMFDSIVSYTKLNYKFLIQKDFVGTLSGIEEGGYLYLAVNNLLGNFGSNLTKTVGTLDLGSGSTQITFFQGVGANLPASYEFTFPWGNSVNNVYSTSFDGLGYITARYTLNNTYLSLYRNSKKIQNPCFLKGYSEYNYLDNTTFFVEGDGNWDNCQSFAFNLLNKTRSCPIPQCSFDGAFQPPLKGSFYASSNYRDVTKFLGVGNTGPISDIQKKGNKFCKLTWSEAQKEYPNEKLDDLSTYCFGAVYISTLLTQGYEFTDQTIRFAKNVDDFPITWTMGLMITKLQTGW